MGADLSAMIDQQYVKEQKKDKENRTAARLIIAGYSRDVNDCRELLEALGLLPS